MPLFTPESLDVLRRSGLNLSYYPDYIHEINASPSICLEAPLVLQCRLFLDHPVSVGCFTGIYGGRVRMVEIGRYCSIALNFQTSWEEHPIDRLTSSMASYVPDVHGWASRYGVDIVEFEKRRVPFIGLKGQTVVGNDVWIGHNVFLRSGICIGNGVIVGANSVVTHNLPSYCVAAGNPARVIRMRFSDKTIERLERFQWWRFNIFDLPPEILGDPDHALDWLEEASSCNRIKEFQPQTFDFERIAAISG